MEIEDWHVVLAVGVLVVIIVLFMQMSKKDDPKPTKPTKAPLKLFKLPAGYKAPAKKERDDIFSLRNSGNPSNEDADDDTFNCPAGTHLYDIEDKCIKDSKLVRKGEWKNADWDKSKLKKLVMVGVEDINEAKDYATFHGYKQFVFDKDQAQYGGDFEFDKDSVTGWQVFK